MLISMTRNALSMFLLFLNSATPDLPDTQDIAERLENINNSLNIIVYGFSVLTGITEVFLIMLLLYKIFSWFSD